MKDDERMGMSESELARQAILSQYGKETAS